MSKPMTIKQIKDIEMRVAGSTSPLTDDIFTLLAEVARLKRLAKPNRKPKTRKRASSYCGGGYIGQDGQTHSFPSYD